jgi:hypothetical protein
VHVSWLCQDGFFFWALVLLYMMTHGPIGSVRCGAHNCGISSDVAVWQKQQHLRLSLFFLWIQSSSSIDAVVAGTLLAAAVVRVGHYGENAWTDWPPASWPPSSTHYLVVLLLPVPLLAHPQSCIFFFLLKLLSDLVVYLGEQPPAPQRELVTWDRAISPTRSRGIPWVLVFGNHDDMPFEWFSPAASVPSPAGKH